MKHHPSCPDGVHAHSLGYLAHVTLMPGSGVVWDDGELVLVANNTQIAERVAELLRTHGFADIPDDLSAIAAPWPAPDPNTRQETP